MDKLFRDDCKLQELSSWSFGRAHIWVNLNILILAEPLAAQSYLLFVSLQPQICHQVADQVCTYAYFLVRVHASQVKTCRRETALDEG